MPQLFLGKSGADAIFRYVAAICRVVLRYNIKLRTLINLAHSHDYISTTQRDEAIAFLDGLSSVCAVFEILSGLSGFTDNS